MSRRARSKESAGCYLQHIGSVAADTQLTAVRLIGSGIATPRGDILIE
jgi:hypothetical protein